MTDSTRPALTFRHWLIIIIASIGFLFDTYELLMTPLVGVPAIAELLNLPPNNPVVTEWIGKLQWMSAACGGVFGLLGGWLIDRFGRKRIMAASIFLYAFSPFAAAYSTTIGSFMFFRCTTFIGVCVEFVAAITWLAELFPDRKQKELVLGSTQAFASLGGVLVTAINAWIVANSATLPALHLPEIFDAHATWRYALMTGLLPAIPIALMLPFVPESQIWREKRAAGTLKRPSFGELFSPALCRVTLVTAVLSACAYAAAFGALQLTPLRIAPGVPELSEQRKQLKPLADEATALNQQLLQVRPSFELAIHQVTGLEELAAQRARNRKAFRAANKAQAKEKVAALAVEFKDLGAKLDTLTASNPDAKKAVVEREKILKALGDNREKVEPLDKQVKERGNTVQLKQETGGLVGRIILAILVVTAISRRALLQLFIIPGLVVLPLAYFNLYHTGGGAFDWSIFLAGMLIVGQFSYFGEYLPKVFPLHLRGTGGSFATNVGGRMIGTSAAFLTTNIIAPQLSGTNTYDKVALAAAIVGTAVLVIALVASFFLPEPPAETVD